MDSISAERNVGNTSVIRSRAWINLGNLEPHAALLAGWERQVGQLHPLWLGGILYCHRPLGSAVERYSEHLTATVGCPKLRAPRETVDKRKAVYPQRIVLPVSILPAGAIESEGDGRADAGAGRCPGSGLLVVVDVGRLVGIDAVVEGGLPASLKSPRNTARASPA